MQDASGVAAIAASGDGICSPAALRYFAAVLAGRCCCRRLFGLCWRSPPGGDCRRLPLPTTCASTKNWHSYAIIRRRRQNLLAIGSSVAWAAVRQRGGRRRDPGASPIHGAFATAGEQAIFVADWLLDRFDSVRNVVCRIAL